MPIFISNNAGLHSAATETFPAEADPYDPETYRNGPFESLDDHGNAALSDGAEAVSGAALDHDLVDPGDFGRSLGECEQAENIAYVERQSSSGKPVAPTGAPDDQVAGGANQPGAASAPVAAAPAPAGGGGAFPAISSEDPQLEMWRRQVRPAARPAASRPATSCSPAALPPPRCGPRGLRPPRMPEEPAPARAGEPTPARARFG